MSEQSKKIIGWAGLAIIVIGTALLLRSQGRIWFAADGSFYIWINSAWSNQNSQHLTDPYSFSHLLHGVLFFGLLYKLSSKISWQWRFNIAVLLEAIWELIENSATVIDRYRNAGALGYSGDAIINSMGDLMSCGLGFIVADYLGFKKSVVLFILVELALLLTIRDCLILNIVMLIHPVEAIKEWQSVLSATI